MNDSFYTATVQLASPVTLQIPIAGPPGYYPPGYSRSRVIPPSNSEPTEAEPEIETQSLTLEQLDCAFWIAPLTQTIHAQIAGFGQPVLLYGPEDFLKIVTDTPEAHGQRLMQILGDDPAAVLQAIYDGQPVALPPRIPQEIAAWRAKSILAINGMLPQVESLIASMVGDEAAVVQVAWANNAPFKRHGPTVLALSSHLNLSSAQIDALFLQAETLEV